MPDRKSVDDLVRCPDVLHGSVVGPIRTHHPGERVDEVFPEMSLRTMLNMAMGAWVYGLLPIFKSSNEPVL